MSPTRCVICRTRSKVTSLQGTLSVTQLLLLFIPSIKPNRPSEDVHYPNWKCNSRGCDPNLRWTSGDAVRNGSRDREREIASAFYSSRLLTCSSTDARPHSTRYSEERRTSWAIWPFDKRSKRCLQTYGCDMYPRTT